MDAGPKTVVAQIAKWRKKAKLARKKGIERPEKTAKSVHKVQDHFKVK